jgi:hypothetical protein
MDPGSESGTCLRIEDLGGVERERERERECPDVVEMVCIEGALLIVMCVYDIRQEALARARARSLSALPRGREDCLSATIRAVTRTEAAEADMMFGSMASD